MRERLAIVSLLLVGLAAVVGAEPPEFILGFDGGAARLTGPDYRQWQWGVSVGGNALGRVNDNFYLGGRVGFSRRGPDKTQLLEALGAPANADITGDIRVLELLPVARLTTNSGTDSELFAQFGGGLYVLDDQVMITSNNGLGQQQIMLGDIKRNRFGVTVGGGISSGYDQFVALEIYSLFNWIFDRDRAHRYLTINAALSMGI